MAAGTIEPAGEARESQTSRSPRGTCHIRAGKTGAAEGQRFFLAKLGAMAFSSSARSFGENPRQWVESLKSGLSYFVVSEWPGIADLSGKKPQVGRQAVRTGPKTG